MEALIGFIAGYLVGSQEGKAGVQRLKDSCNAIVTSPEVRRMAAEAVSMGEVLVRSASRRGVGQIGGTVARTVAARAGGGQREMSHAA